MATKSEVIGFLRGTNALAGRWFGEKVPGMPGYWWRPYLRVLEEPDVPPGAADTSEIRERERQHIEGPPVAYIRDCADPTAPLERVEVPFSRPGETEAIAAAARDFGLDAGDLHAPPRLLPDVLPAGCDTRDYGAHDDEFPTGPA